MSLYVDSSALLKLYLDEPDSEGARDLLRADSDWITARVTQIEVRRNLARQLDGPDLTAAREEFDLDWANTNIVEIDATLCERAAELAEETGARALAALHLGAAQRVGIGIPVLTYDRRQAEAARSLGLAVLGVE